MFTVNLANSSLHLMIWRTLEWLLVLWYICTKIKCTYCGHYCLYVYFKIILQEREIRRQKFLQDIMVGRIEERVLRYMPVMTTEVVNSDLSTAACSEQSAADAANGNSSSATKRAMLLSRIHSRRFREWVLSCLLDVLSTGIVNDILVTFLVCFINLSSHNTV